MPETAYDMRCIATVVAKLLGVREPSSAEASTIPEVAAALGEVEYLAMVVFDAFGQATWKYAQDDSPTVNALAEGKHLTIRAVAPPITPVNFATMATGASPQVHQVRARTDPLELDTIFHTLRQAGKSSAVAARALSSPGMLLAPLADHPAIAATNTDAEVLELALQVLRSKRPHYLLLQFLDIDDASHQHGPFTLASAQAVSQTDARLKTLIEELARHGYALLLLADHGQHPIPPGEHPGYLGWHDGSTDEDFMVPLIWASSERLRSLAQG